MQLLYICRQFEDATSAPFCCPTPPESPDACRKGPVGKSQYVQAGCSCLVLFRFRVKYDVTIRTILAVMMCSSKSSKSGVVVLVIMMMTKVKSPVR